MLVTLPVSVADDLVESIDYVDTQMGVNDVILTVSASGVAVCTVMTAARLTIGDLVAGIKRWRKKDAPEDLKIAMEAPGLSFSVTISAETPSTTVEQALDFLHGALAQRQPDTRA